jgi:hypothetical protein
VEYAPGLRRRGVAEPAAPTARCPICACTIDPADSSSLVFRPDGRVEHRRCPDPVCPSCLQAVAPAQRKLRSGRDIFHEECLRARSSKRSIAGGSAASTWTTVFDERGGTHAHQDRDASAEFRGVACEVRQEAIGLRALARAVRADSMARRSARARPTS